MDIRSPPPPSPSCSEPPPSYDSLSLRRPPHGAPGLVPSSMGPPLPAAAGSLAHHPLHAVTTTSSLQHCEPEAGGEVVVVVVEREEETESPPPPPYSPGLRDRLGAAQNTNDEAYVCSPTRTEEPPSYYSLFGQIQEARQQTNSNVVFLRKLCHIIMSTVGCTLLLLGLIFVPLGVLTLGIIFVNDCPIQPYIPVFLIIGGLAGLIKIMLCITENVVRKKSSVILPRVQHPKVAVWSWWIGNLLFNMLMFLWVIAGSYWIYGTYMDIIAKDFTTCNSFLYKFSFAFVTCSYIFLLLTFSCMCFMAGGASVHKASRQDGGGRTQVATPPTPPVPPRDLNLPPPPPPETTPPRHTPRVPNLNLDAVADSSLAGEITSDDTIRTNGRFRTMNGSRSNMASRQEEGLIPAVVVIGEGLGNTVVHSSMNSLTNPTHVPLSPPPTGGTAHSTLRNQRSYSQSNARSYPMSRQQLSPVYTNFPVPTPNSRPFQHMFEGPPSHPLHLRRQASFGPNDTHLRPPLHTATSFSVIRAAKSFSHMHGDDQKDLDRPHSIPHLYGPQSNDLDRRYCSHGNPGNLCESTTSSLYSTSHLDGFSITAV